MADVAADLKNWSTTASSNAPTDSTTIGAGLADNFQEVQKVVRQDLAHKGADITAAATTDLGAVAGSMHDITGTTTITSFGTVSAGIRKAIKFEGALTLTHNATSLILPNAANITTADGDTAEVISEGSGNWRVLSYAGKSAYHTNLTLSGNLVASGAGPHAVGGATSAAATLNLAGAQAVTGTDGATLRIGAASTGATNNYALWVDAGKTRLDDYLLFSGTASNGLTYIRGVQINEVDAINIWGARFSSAASYMAFAARSDTSSTGWLSTYGSAVGRSAIIADDAAVSVLTGGSTTTAVDSAVTLSEQVRITHTASATRYITLTGSNGGNPTIGTSAGTLSISSNAKFISAIGVGVDESATTWLNLSASATGASSLRVPHGSAPSSPVDGDIWTTTAGLFVRLNGSTIGPLS